MDLPAFDTVAWFQVGSDKPEEVEQFYGDLFDWKFNPEPGNDGYDLIEYRDNKVPGGGVAHVADASENHAVFFVIVQDVPATVAAAERLGGKVLVAPTASPSGLVLAHLLDPSGNRFGVFSPPPAS
ncbi:VOC family protein [Nocardia sp. NPDC050406]|uniref:VOC family protein n=1 Tax=Nocardia sp. NPDC050406 TaxID=3364318 RepID=UPI0037BDC67D